MPRIAPSIEGTAGKYFTKIESKSRNIITMKLLPAIIVVMVALTVRAQENQPLIGEKAPGFTLTSLDGKTYSLDALKGTYVVLHIATTWCPFCNAEAPYLEQLNKDFKNKNVQVLLIDVKEDQALVRKVFSKYNFTFPVLLDPDGTTSAKYAPPGVLPDLPRDEVPLASNLIIDKQGQIQFYSLLDSRNFDARLVYLRQRLEELLAAEQ